MSLRLHGHPLSSFCWKALTALYEDDAEFEFVLVDLSDPEAAARFRRISPLGMMPALEDTEAGRVVLESSLVIEHLDLRRGESRFLPADPAAAQEVRFWDRFYDLYVQGPMQRIVADRLRPAAARPIRRGARPRTASGSLCPCGRRDGRPDLGGRRGVHPGRLRGCAGADLRREGRTLFAGPSGPDRLSRAAGGAAQLRPRPGRGRALRPHVPDRLSGGPA